MNDYSNIPKDNPPLVLAGFGILFWKTPKDFLVIALPEPMVTSVETRTDRQARNGAEQSFLVHSLHKPERSQGLCDKVFDFLFHGDTAARLKVLRVSEWGVNTPSNSFATSFFSSFFFILGYTLNISLLPVFTRFALDFWVGCLSRYYGRYNDFRGSTQSALWEFSPKIITP